MGCGLVSQKFHPVNWTETPRARSKLLCSAKAELAGKRFLGARRIDKIDPFDAPSSRRAKGKLSPRCAAGTAEGQRLGRKRHAAFVVAYPAAYGRTDARTTAQHLVRAMLAPRRPEASGAIVSPLLRRAAA